ncbi:MAG: hypothetical protein GY812_06870 [Actinomycetia bacterium]|nr:hypothetical protein [Actinomycetes bacterium]
MRRWVCAAMGVALVGAACTSGGAPGGSGQFVLRDTSQIVLDEERSYNAFELTSELDYYVNNAYECGLSGNYSFFVMNPAGAPDANAPLWVYLHGGGVGYYGDEGDYVALTFQDENAWNHQESFDALIGIVEERVFAGDGQPEDQTLVRRIEDGYRVLVVSYCDHDQYSGLGTSYTNHPTNPNAQVNGLQATMAAIDYVAANYPTTQVWAHGTSAGSTGVWSLASSYGQEGTALTGVVADSTIMSPRLVDLIDALKGTPGFPFGAEFETQGVTDKIGYFADPQSPSLPEAQIANQDFRSVPVFFVYGLMDVFCGGDMAPIPEASAAGLTNCEYFFADLEAAVDSQVDSPHEVHALNEGHVPTLDPGTANDLVDDFIDRVLATNPPNFGSLNG